jgi:hypothetical protein
MKFEFKYGLIWVCFKIQYESKEVFINNCILDTGSSTTAIDIDLVNFNYKKHSEIKRLFGIGGGTQEVISQKIDKICIGNQEVHDISIECNRVSDPGDNGRKLI